MASNCPSADVVKIIVDFKKELHKNVIWINLQSPRMPIETLFDFCIGDMHEIIPKLFHRDFQKPIKIPPATTKIWLFEKKLRTKIQCKPEKFTSKTPTFSKKNVSK
jgi:hypothetical protein